MVEKPPSNLIGEAAARRFVPPNQAPALWLAPTTFTVAGTYRSTYRTKCWLAPTDWLQWLAPSCGWLALTGGWN